MTTRKETNESKQTRSAKADRRERRKQSNTYVSENCRETARNDKPKPGQPAGVTRANPTRENRKNDSADTAPQCPK